MTDDTRYRFTSSPAVHAPGMVEWLRRCDRRTFNAEATDELVRIGFAAQMYPDAPGWALEALAQGRYTVDGDALIVEDRFVGPAGDQDRDWSVSV